MTSLAALGHTYEHDGEHGPHHAASILETGNAVDVRFRALRLERRRIWRGAARQDTIGYYTPFIGS